MFGKIISAAVPVLLFPAHWSALLKLPLLYHTFVSNVHHNFFLPFPSPNLPPFSLPACLHFIVNSFPCSHLTKPLLFAAFVPIVCTPIAYLSASSLSSCSPFCARSISILDLHSHGTTLTTTCNVDFIVRAILC